MPAWIESLLALLALPQFGLSTLFVVAFVSATLLPLGSEPALLGLVTLNPGLFRSALVVATIGNTLGGVVDWWMGHAARAITQRYAGSHAHVKALDLLQRLGPKACLLAWLPVVGDPLCAVAGWLQMPLAPCVVYMAIGKFLRYLFLTAGLLWLFPH
jgi:membrane protein YqaA with SNARE-associated domain